MLGMKLHDPISGLTGTVDAQSVTGDAKALVRLCDRWFFAEALVAA